MKTEIKVEKGMKVGDSFVYPLSKRAIVGSCARYVKVSITSRAISETELRVWKTSNTR